MQAKNSFGSDKDLHFGAINMMGKPGPLAGGFPNLMTSGGMIGANPDPNLQLG
jgi:hypothetical protein